MLTGRGVLAGPPTVTLRTPRAAELSAGVVCCEVCGEAVRALGRGGWRPD